MRQGTIGDTTITLDDTDYQTLLSRTDLNNITRGRAWYVMDKSCICDRHTKGLSCYKCPLLDGVKCARLFNLISQTEVLVLRRYEIHWSEKDNEEVRAGIQRVHDWLLNMEVV